MYKTLNEWLNHLEQAHPITIDMGLDRVNQVKKLLNINENIPIIIVGGTNGKGSTCGFLSSILTAAHYNVGLYTSPHLICFNERIKINNQMVDDELIIQAFNHVENIRKQANISLSYFEFTTLAAMVVFSNKNVDSIVLEVGLGGRLDATNIFNPQCAIITSIGIDHIEYLGNTREQIAQEKAGIMRENIPVICGDSNTPHTLIDYAQNINANLYLIGKDFSYTSEESQWNFYSELKNIPSISHPTLKGMNQLQNASCAIMALNLIKHILPVSNQDIRRGLIEIELDGRFTILAGQPTIVMDVAHNAHASLVLADNLDRMGFYPKNIAIFGAMQDKDIPSMLYPLKDIIDEWHICTLPTARSASLEQLHQAITLACPNKPIYQYQDFGSAYINIKQNIKQEERIAIFGSFYTVAEAMKYVKLSDKELNNMQSSIDNNINDEADDMSDDNHNNSQHRIKSYVRRTGRVTPSQQKALDNLSDKWIIEYKNEQMQNPSQNLILEIGFGMGETTAKIAQTLTNNNFIAVEVHTAGVGALLKRIEEQNITNINIMQHDAFEVIQNMLPDQCLSGVHIFFPDPWHKKKHHKRRLIQEQFINMLLPKLKQGGYIHCATDWQNYAEHILLTLSQNDKLQNTSKNADGYADKPSYRPTTKFENRGIKLGHGVWDIIFTKK
ncbi:MAG: hypothetical protein RLZZ210_20 [Pseudomonadota bacterium]|jgi:dihydrofolate synthase/folylpolyglutamate synthase